MLQKNRSFLIFGGAVLVGLIVAILWRLYFPAPYVFQGSLITPSRQAPDFYFLDQSENPFQLSSHSGQIVLVFFGYTYCPDVCPTTLQDARWVQQNLGEDLERLDFVFITVDPKRDSREHLESHLALFSDRFYGLTGTSAELLPVYEDYGVYVEYQATGDENSYLVDHTSQIYVVDSAGNLRLTFPFGMAREDMLKDIKYLLEEDV